MKQPIKINFVSVVVNGIKLYKLVKKLIRQLRRKNDVLEEETKTGSSDNRL